MVEEDELYTALDRLAELRQRRGRWRSGRCAATVSAIPCKATPGPLRTVWPVTDIQAAVTVILKVLVVFTECTFDSHNELTYTVNVAVYVFAVR